MLQIKFDESFNWLAVLKDLAAGAPLSHEKHLALRKLAHDWPTCACADICQALPRTTGGRPLDVDLQWLGVDFYEMIINRDWRGALSQFHQIEARTSELLALNPENPVNPVSNKP